MYCNRLHAWWSTQSWLATLLSSLIACRWVVHLTLWWFILKDLSIDEMVGAWCFGCLSGHRDLPVGFHLLWYSVLFTVESLSLLYLLVISWFICSRRGCIDKLGVFHANQISMCLDPHLNWGWGWRRETSLSPPVKYFYWLFQGGTSFVDLLCFFSILCLLCLCARLIIRALWSPYGKGLTSWLSFVVFTVSLSLSDWYSGSGVVLDCIDSWSLHPYLLSFMALIWIKQWINYGKLPR